MARIRDTVKVKAHLHEVALTCPTERWRARGNNVADEAAKAARGRHPQPGVDITSLVAFWTRRAPHVVRAVGVAMTEFPAVGGYLKRKNCGGTAAASGDQSQGDAADRHSWTYAEGRWRCAKCWTYVLGESVPPRRYGEKCDAGRIDDRMRQYDQHGHTMLLAEGNLPIAYCVRCGGWSSRRAQRLLAKCGPPTEAGKAALRRIERGFHPWRARDKTSGGELPRTNLTTVRPGRRGDATVSSRHDGEKDDRGCTW